MIRSAVTDNDILKCQKVLSALRPHLIKEEFLKKVKSTIADNRTLIFIEEENEAVSAAVFEEGYNLYRGNYIYIDDVSTLPAARNKGYASQLLDWIINYARDHDIDQIHLDSGVNSDRWNAHRLYLNKKFNITSLHLAINLK